MLDTLFRPAAPRATDDGAVIDRVAHFQAKQQQAMMRLPREDRHACGQMLIAIERAMRLSDEAIRHAIAAGEYEDALTALDEMRLSELNVSVPVHPLVLHAFAERRGEIVRRLYVLICDAA